MSNWVITSLTAKHIDGRPHVEVKGVWCTLNIPTYIEGTKLAVKKEFFVSEEDILANHVKDYYAGAGAQKWERTDVRGTKMGDTKYAWDGDDYVPLNIPVWIDPESNLISTPTQFVGKLNEIINFTS